MGSGTNDPDGAALRAKFENQIHYRSKYNWAAGPHRHTRRGALPPGVPRGGKMQHRLLSLKEPKCKDDNIC